MKMSQGIEWSIHCCALLALLPPKRTLRIEKIAQFYDLPVPYLRKHFQDLSRAGILKTTSGPKGGYRLAREAKEVNLLHIYEAIEGPEHAFRCNEIRQNGPNTCGQKVYPAACNIATSMWKAEEAFRRELEKISLEDIVKTAALQISPERRQKSAQWLEEALSNQ